VRDQIDERPQPEAADSEGSAGLAVVGILGLALIWFAVSWLALDSPVVDAAGEAAGGVLAVLVVVSVVGALRRSCKR
jgi:hypothetical protein